MALKHGLDKHRSFGGWHGLEVAGRLKTPKQKRKGLDFIEFELHQTKLDQKGRRLPKSDLWRVHFVQSSPFSVKVRFSRRRGPKTSKFRPR